MKSDQIAKVAAKVGRRHPDIPQDALFEMKAKSKGDGSRRRSQVALYARNCPDCKRKVGILLVGTNTVWREHYRSTMSGASLRCRRSSQLSEALPQQVCAICDQGKHRCHSDWCKCECRETS